ncbi:unnamed protein product, partial [Prorocentrum cordatum]
MGVCSRRFLFLLAISACAKGGRADLALGLLEGIERARLRPDVVSLNASISACDWGGRTTGDTETWLNVVQIAAGTVGLEVPWGSLQLLRGRCHGDVRTPQGEGRYSQ